MEGFVSFGYHDRRKAIHVQNQVSPTLRLESHAKFPPRLMFPLFSMTWKSFLGIAMSLSNSYENLVSLVSSWRCIEEYEI